jgi:hypothetical protein
MRYTMQYVDNPELRKNCTVCLIIKHQLMLTQIQKAALAVLFSAVVMWACDPKDDRTEPLQSLPVARAGNDFNVYLPTERQFKLNGASSYDPDGAGYAMSYNWTKLSGPEIFDFQPTLTSPFVIIRETGTYTFELKVTDVQSNVARDTVQVTAVWGLGCDPDIVFDKSTYDTVFSLNDALPYDVSIGTSGNNIIFAGGRTEQDDGWGGADIFDSAMYVYNTANNSVSKTALSSARAAIGIAVAGNEVFLAGGIYSNNVSDAVDIYNLSSRTMKKAKLSVARSSVKTVVSGHLVFFVGGRDKNNQSLDVVDIYDVNSGTWSVAKLSVPRADMAAIAYGTKVVFAGGDLSPISKSNRIDVYDVNSGQWITSSLPSSRSHISSAILGDEIVFDGGSHSWNPRIDQVDFLNPATMSIRSVCMVGRDGYNMEFGQNMNTVVIGNKLYFLGNSVLSSYVQGQSKWTMTYPPEMMDLFAVFSSGSQLYGLSSPPDFKGLYMMKVEIIKINF